MAHYQVILSYDGTDFQGFQRQTGRRTVQGEFERCLRALGWRGTAILAAGRTDTGVHAAGQVVGFEFEWHHTPGALVRALNAALPKDIAVQSAALMNEGFHPRYDARARQYRYAIYCQANMDPLRDRYAWRVWPAPDGTLLKQAADLLVGTRDFGALGRPPKVGGSTVRTVFRTDWQEVEGGWLFKVSANAFLYHMVRRMVYLQVRAGQGSLSIDRLAEIIAHRDEAPPGLAPARGLVLETVRYTLLEEEYRMISGDVNWKEL